MQLEGVPNFHQVSTNLYRSAQPTAQGMRKLKQRGIATVVNLRSFNSEFVEFYLHFALWDSFAPVKASRLKETKDQKRHPNNGG